MRSEANEKQVGGKHYRSEYQHWDLSLEFGNRYLESQVSKYVTRWRKKNGLQDLEKALHFLLKTIEAAAMGMIQAPTVQPAGWIDRIAQYSRSNELDKDQHAIVCTVHTWTSTTELNAIRLRLEAYLLNERTRAQQAADAEARAEAGGAGPAYVGQAAS